MLKILLGIGLTMGLAQTMLADEWSKRFAVSGRPSLRVDTNDGAVDIRAWDHKEIAARVSTAGWKIGPGEVTVVDRQSGDHVELEVRIPHRVFAELIGHRNVRIELQVPAELSTEVHTGDGGINVDGVHGDTRLSTGDGHIEAYHLDGRLNAQTGDGHLRVRGRFDALDLHTGDGGIDAEVENGSKMSSGWSVRTGDGHVTLRLPQSFSAELDVHTGDGHIDSDLPVTITGSRHENELRGKLNAGGLPLMIRTNDGSIRLERL